MLEGVPQWEIAMGFFALVAALWSRIRQVCSWIAGWVIVTNQVDANLVSVVLGYLNSLAPTKQRTKLREIGYFNSEEWYVRSLERSARVCFRVLSGRSMLSWYGKRPIWYSVGEPDESSSFSFLRWTVNWTKLLQDACNWEDLQKQRESAETQNRYDVYRIFGSSGANSFDDDDNQPRSTGRKSRTDSLNRQLQNVELLHYEREDIGEPREQASLDNLSLDQELQDVVEEAEFWRESEEWCKQRGIAWRRSFLYEGPPGSGKTSMSRGIAEHLDLPVYCPDLATMSNEDFHSCWSSLAQNAPCMMLMEDVDSVFHGRQNVTKSSLTFDCVLNCIDGAKRPDGVLLIITTNHADKLDPALKRPGRVDRIVTFKPVDYHGKVKIANRILDDDILAKMMATKYEKESPAEFQEMCIRMAIDRRFAERKKAV